MCSWKQTGLTPHSCEGLDEEKDCLCEVEVLRDHEECDTRAHVNNHREPGEYHFEVKCRKHVMTNDQSRCVVAAFLHPYHLAANQRFRKTNAAPFPSFYPIYRWFFFHLGPFLIHDSNRKKETQTCFDAQDFFGCALLLRFQLLLLLLRGGNNKQHACLGSATPKEEEQILSSLQADPLPPLATTREGESVLAP